MKFFGLGTCKKCNDTGFIETAIRWRNELGVNHGVDINPCDCKAGKRMQEIDREIHEEQEAFWKAVDAGDPSALEWLNRHS